MELQPPATPSTKSGVLLRRSPSQSSKTPTITPDSSPTVSPYSGRKRRKSSRLIPCHQIFIWSMLCIIFVGAIISRFPQLFARKPPSILRSLHGSDNTTLSSSLFSKWTQSDVIHVIQTRFMQQQPHLVSLGLARLKIFESFCLPTMSKQTSQEFIWIIRTDPDLDEGLKKSLLLLLDGHANYLLVASNDNPEGFRHAEAIHDITANSLWTGDLNLVKDVHDAAQSRIVLETRLDGDDGLHTSFVEYIQDTARQYIVDPMSWTIWCTFNHMEWQYSSPFSVADDAHVGYWIGVRSPGCVTPGLTMVYGVDVSRDDLPRGTHQYLHKVAPSCKDDADDHCLRRFRELMPGAIRARTPTSAGMANVIVGQHGERDIYKRAQFQADLQEDIWKGVESVFYVTRERAKDVREYLQNNLQLIAADNLTGQCTKGHSCKTKSKNLLQAILTDVSLSKA